MGLWTGRPMKAFQNPSNGSLRHENHWNKKWIYSHLRPPSFCESCQVCSTNTLGIPMNNVASIKLWEKDGSKPGYPTHVFPRIHQQRLIFPGRPLFFRRISRSIFVKTCRHSLSSSNTAGARLVMVSGTLLQYSCGFTVRALSLDLCWGVGRRIVIVVARWIFIREVDRNVYGDWAARIGRSHSRNQDCPGLCALASTPLKVSYLCGWMWEKPQTGLGVDRTPMDQTDADGKFPIR